MNIDDIKALSIIVAGRRRDWPDLGPIRNAIIKLAETWDDDTLVTRLPIACQDLSIRTPAGLLYVDLGGGPVGQGGSDGTSHGPTCIVCQRPRHQHDRINNLVDGNAKHPWATERTRPEPPPADWWDARRRHADVTREHRDELTWRHVPRPTPPTPKPEPEPEETDDDCPF